jgi:lipid-A-disaccharide synthase-like uncharacterized protein
LTVTFDLHRVLGEFLYEVFVLQFDWWVVLGFIAQIMFTGRFAVQWLASERAGKMVMPIAFWFFSIAGGVLLLIYAIHRKDPVFIAGQGFGVFVYARNLYFELRDMGYVKGKTVKGKRPVRVKVATVRKRKAA